MSFASFPLETLGLRKDQVAVCQRNNIHTAADVLLSPTHELTKKLKWRIEAVQALVRDVSRAIAPRTSSVGVLTSGSGSASFAARGMGGEASGSGSASASMSRGRSGNGRGFGGGSRSQGQDVVSTDTAQGRGDVGTRSRSRSKSQGAGAASQPALITASNASPEKGTGRSTGSGYARTRSSSQVGGRKLKGYGGYAEGDWISTGDEGWDRLLCGGLRLGTLVEISGESAAGKSHLALSLSIAAQLPTLSTLPGGTIFLTSEREISTSRLKDISRHMLAQHGKSDFRTPSKLMEGVITNRVGDVDALERTLHYQVPAILDMGRAGFGSAKGVVGNEDNASASEVMSDMADQIAAEPVPATPPLPGSRLLGFPPSASIQAEFDACRTLVNAERLKPSSLSSRSTNTANRTNALPRTTSRIQAHKPRMPIRLIVLDSITALLRGAEVAFSSSSAGLTARSRLLCNTADRLKALAVEYNLAVVIINQVSDVFDRRGFGGAQVPDEDEEDEASAGTCATGTGTNGDASRQGDGQMPPPALPFDPHAHAIPSQPARPSQSHPSSSQSQPGLTHSQAWATTGPDPPMLYATQSKWFSGQSSARTKEAALGVVWANAINVRLMLSRTGRRRIIAREDVVDGAERGTKRRLVDALRAGGDESGVAMAQARKGNFGLIKDPTGNGSLPSAHAAGDGRDGEVRLEWAEEDAVEEEDERILIRRAQCVFSPHAASATIDYVITCSGIHSVNSTWKREDSGEEVLKRQKRLRAAVTSCAAADAHGLQGDEEDVGSHGDDGGGQRGDPYDEEGMYGDQLGDGGLDVPEEWWNGTVGDA